MKWPFIKLLAVIYVLTGLVVLYYFCHSFFLTAFGVGWAGADTTTIEILWMWFHLFLFGTYSTLAGIGMSVKRDFGWLFGLVTPLAVIIHLLFGLLLIKSNENSTPTMSELLSVIFIVLILALIFLITKNTINRMSIKINYALIISLSVLPSIFWYINYTR